MNIKNSIKKLFHEMESSRSFAESASISGDFNMEDIPEIVKRGKIVILEETVGDISNENELYEIQCLKDMFYEMGCSYSFSEECAETMEVELDDMREILDFVSEKIDEAWL